MELSVDITTDCDRASLYGNKRMSSLRTVQYLPQVARLTHPEAPREPVHPSQHVVLLLWKLLQLVQRYL